MKDLTTNIYQHVQRKSNNNGTFSRERGYILNLEYAKSRFLVVSFAETIYSLSALIFLALAVLAGYKSSVTGNDF
jgi:hypothetical protein